MDIFFLSQWRIQKQMLSAGLLCCDDCQVDVAVFAPCVAVSRSFVTLVVGLSLVIGQLTVATRILCCWYLCLLIWVEISACMYVCMHDVFACHLQNLCRTPHINRNQTGIQSWELLFAKYYLPWRNLLLGFYLLFCFFFYSDQC